jgi:hypothetical protein
MRNDKKRVICAKTLSFFGLLPRPKIDFGGFNPMFALKADLGRMRFLQLIRRWSASFYRP